MISCDQCGKQITQGKYVEIKEVDMGEPVSFQHDVFITPGPSMKGQFCSDLCATAKAISVNLIYSTYAMCINLVKYARENPNSQFDPQSVMRPPTKAS